MNEELPNMSLEFQAFPKMARLSRNCTITEKIDGTNAQILIVPADEWSVQDAVLGNSPTFLVERWGKKFFVNIGSRNRWLTEEQDNFGFCKWAKRSH